MIILNNATHNDNLGKFQLQVMSGCGHMVHEDNPDKVRKYCYT